MPTWKDSRGRKHRLVPTALSGNRVEAETRHAFYLDAGPLFLVYSGLLDADDEMMKSTLLWFREGPPQRFYRYDGNLSQLPAIHREISSCEPCYSWNVFHPWQTGDRQKFLEGMYSLFAGALSRKTCISCETRGGITGNIFASPLAVYMARLAVADDQLKENELHLLRLMPLAWLRRGATAAFEKLPTEFGPVSLRTKISRDGTTLDVAFDAAFRSGPPKVILHFPPVEGLRKVRLNGKPLKVTRKRTVIMSDVTDV